jgi:hypothetical protein
MRTTEKTEKNDRRYWHVKMQKTNQGYELRLRGAGRAIDITKYQIL